jgi:hypothetical protein
MSQSLVSVVVCTLVGSNDTCLCVVVFMTISTLVIRP